MELADERASLDGDALLAFGAGRRAAEEAEQGDALGEVGERDLHVVTLGILLVAVVDAEHLEVADHDAGGLLVEGHLEGVGEGLLVRGDLAALAHLRLVEVDASALLLDDHTAVGQPCVDEAAAWVRSSKRHSSETFFVPMTSRRKSVQDRTVSPFS